MSYTIRQVLSFLSILMLSWLLVGCGFHLRGRVDLAPPLKRLYIQSADPYSQLIRNLKQSLQLSGVDLSKTPQTASMVLDILNETTKDQLLSVGGTQQTRQYNLTLTVTFQITDPAGKIVVPSQSVFETQVITITANQILGGSNEENNLYQQMRHLIINDILKRLASDDVKNAVTTPKQ